MAQIGAAWINFEARIKEVEKAFQKVDTGFKKNQKSASRFAGFMKSQVGQLSATIGGLFAVRAIGRFFKSSVKEARRFENEMRRINTVTQLTSDSLERLGKDLRDMSKTLMVPIEELQAGMFDVASAGIEAENQINFLVAASAFAKVGFFDTAVAVQGLTAILKGYGVGLSDTEKIMNLFLQTNIKGQTTLGDLAAAVQGTATDAEKAGVKMEEMFAILATGTGVVGNASEVATAMSAAFLALSAPTRRAENQFKKMGITVGKAMIEEKGFVAVAKEVVEAVDGDAIALRRLIPSSEAATLIMSLATAQNEKFVENLIDMQSELDLVAKQFAEYASSTEGQIVLMENAWLDAQGAVGDFIKTWVILLVQLGRKPMRSITNAGLRVENAVRKAAVGVVKLGRSAASALTGEAAPAVEALGGVIENLQDGVNRASRVIEADFTDMVMTDAMKQLEKSLNAVGGSTQRFGGAARKAAKDADELNKGLKEGAGASEDSIDNLEDAHDALDGIGKGMEDWQKGIEDTEKKLKRLAEKNAEFMEDIRKQIRGVTHEITELQGAFEEEVAEEMIRAADKVREIEEELRKEDISDERIKSLEEEKKALNEMMESGNQLIEEGIISQEAVTEARRLAGLNAIEIMTEQWESEKAIMEERKLLMEQLQAGEEIDLGEIKDFENLQMAEGLLARQATIDAEIQMVEDEQKAIQQAWIDGGKEIIKINEEIIKVLDTKYKDLAMRIKLALAAATKASRGGGVGGFATGGFTGAGNSKDIAGVVHRNEWVMPSKMVSRLAPTGLLSVLEGMRRGLRGFQEGGPTSPIPNQNIEFNQNNIITEKLDLTSVGEEMLFMLKQA